MSDEAKPAGAGELDLNAIRGQPNPPEGAGEKESIGAPLQTIAAIGAHAAGLALAPAPPRSILAAIGESLNPHSSYPRSRQGDAEAENGAGRDGEDEGVG